MHIEITVKREASPQIVLNNLYKYSQMQVTFGIIMLAIVNGVPKILNLKDILRITLISRLRSLQEELSMISERLRKERIFLKV